MAFVYGNRRRADIKRLKPGYKNVLLVAPVSWFTLIGEPTAAGTAAGDSVDIPATASHTFAVGKGFLEMYAAPKKTTAKGATQGDAGSRSMVWTATAVLPGDGPEVQELLDNLLNEDLIVLQKDANCPNGSYIQYGCDCNPASMEKSDFDGGTTDSGTKGWTVELQANCRFYYKGTVTMFP